MKRRASALAALAAAVLAGSAVAVTTSHGATPAGGLSKINHIVVVFEELYGLTPDQVGEVRSRFAVWPRP